MRPRIMSNYVVCIPSYRRPKQCAAHTLATLRTHRIARRHIYVFVANSKEYNEYVHTLDTATYEKLVIGKPGIVSQRQFIQSYFGSGKHIVMMDDDIKDVDLSQYRYHHPGTSLHAFIKHAFEECKKRGAHMWGVYPVRNYMFMRGRPEITSCLSFIVGAFFGVINRPGCLSRTEPQVVNSEKEDVERSIRFFITDGITLRFNHVTITTAYYGTDGGDIGRFEDRLQRAAVASYRLKEAYPAYGDVRVRKNGMTEFRLRSNVCVHPGNADTSARLLTKELKEI